MPLPSLSEKTTATVTNDTVDRSVDGMPIGLLGQVAGARGTRVTMPKSWAKISAAKSI